MLLTPEGPPATPVTTALIGSAAAPIPCRPDSLAEPELSLRTTMSGSASSSAVIHFSLPSAAPAKLDLFDLSGRRIWGSELAPARGAHAMSLPDEARLAPGLYFVKLTQAGLSA